MSRPSERDELPDLTIAPFGAADPRFTRFALLGVVSYGLAVQTGVALPLVGAFLGFATLVIGLSTTADLSPRVERYIGPVGIVCFALVWLTLPSYAYFPHPPIWVVLAFLASVVLAGAVLLARGEAHRTLIRLALGGSVAAVAVLGVALVAATPDTGVDVFFLHRAAADAFSQGLNIYGEAVDVANGSPYAIPGSRIIGYPYPPVTALAFAVSDWILSDPRWVGLGSWVGFLVLLATRAIKQTGRGPALAVVLLALLPGWPLVIQAGWTETFTVVLLGLAAFYWYRIPWLSAGVLGMALATKQYFLVAFPLLLIHPEMRWRRSAIALTVAAMAVAVAFIPDPRAAWHALVEFHGTTEPRPDSSNLVGLTGLLGYAIRIPIVVALVLPMLVAFFVRPWLRARSDLFGGLALVLTTFFLLANQTNANYWFLIVNLAALSGSCAAASVSNGEMITASGPMP